MVTGSVRAGVGPACCHTAHQSLPGADVPDHGRITGLQDFGRELSLARQQAGLTIREISCAR